MTSPPVAEATFSPQSDSASERGTATGFMLRILAHCEAAGESITPAKAKRLGIRIARRAERMQEEFDFFAEMRILGMTPDPTARDAIKAVTG